MEAPKNLWSLVKVGKNKYELRIQAFCIGQFFHQSLVPTNSVKYFFPRALEFNFKKEVVSEITELLKMIIFFHLQN